MNPASTVILELELRLALTHQTQPSLKTHGDEAQWGVWANEAIEGNPMFGKVQRNGKVSKSQEHERGILQIVT